MEIGIEKCAKLMIKSGKAETIERIELQNWENIRLLGEKENYKCFVKLEVNTAKQRWRKHKKMVLSI